MPQPKFESAAPDSHPRGLSGATATIESLKSLLEQGDPNIRNRPAWTPHRPPRPDKSEGGRAFRIVSEYEPRGDQPQAIVELVEGIVANERDQVLLGVTGSGKTFTMANVIERVQKPTLILSHNKTLAAQLYGELVKPVVRHASHANVFLARVASLFQSRLGQNLEQRCLAHLRQADNASLHARPIKAPAR